MQTNEGRVVRFDKPPQLGRWKAKTHGWEAAKDKAVKACRRKAYLVYEPLLPKIKEMQDAGWSTEDIAGWLNAVGHRTSAHMPFTAVAVWRIIRRYLRPAA